MNPFRPIRPYYRDIVVALIPTRLSFRPALHDSSVVELDCGWMQSIFDATPTKYRDDLRLRIDSIHRLLSVVLPTAGDMQQFLRLPINNLTMGLMSEHLARHDNERRVRRLSTSIEMIRHELGVERTCLPLN